MGPSRIHQQGSPDSSNDPFEVVLDALDNASLGASASSSNRRGPPPAAGFASDPFDAVSAELSSPPPRRPPAISTSASHGRSSRTLHAATSLPSTRSAPASGGTNVLGGARVRGYLNGKVHLFRYGQSKVGTLCGGFVGGSQGTGLRFCCKELEAGKSRCGDSKHAAKYAMEPDSYYIPMENSTALTWPFLRLKDLLHHNAISIVSQAHTSREWIQVVGDFIQDHDLDAPVADAAVGEGGDTDDISIMGVSVRSHQLSVRDSQASSIASIKAGSKSTWDALRPETLNEPSVPINPDAKWFQHYDFTYKAVRDLHSAFNRLVDELPQSFDALNVDIERQGGVSYETFSDEALQPIQILIDRVDELGSSAFGHQTDLYGHTSWVGSGSLSGFLEELSTRLRDMESRLLDITATFVPSEINKMAVKAASTIREIGERAAQAREALEDRIAILEANSVNVGGSPSPGVVPAPTAVPGALGVVGGETITLESLVRQLQDVTSENAALRREVTSLKTSTSASGVKVGEYSFEALEDVVKFVQDEGDVNLEAFALFLDAVSYFSHYVSGEQTTEKNTTEIAAMRKAGITDPTCCAYVASFRSIHPSFLLGNLSTVALGSRFPLLKSKVDWEGQISVVGGRGSLKQAVKAVRETAKEYITVALPRHSSELRALALELVTRTHEWWTDVITYIDEEILTLSQFGIAEEPVFTFICDELQCMFKKMFEERMKMQVFSTTRDPTLYYARCIWYTLHAHMIMDEFKDAKFGTHTLISSLFIRFLAQQTGSNHGANLATQIKTLDGDIKKVNNALNSKSTAINGRLDKLDTRVKAAEATCASAVAKCTKAAG